MLCVVCGALIVALELAIGVCCQLVVAFFVFSVFVVQCCWMLRFGFVRRLVLLFSVCCVLLVCRLLFVGCCLLFAVCCSLYVVWCFMLVVCCLLFNGTYCGFCCW